MKSFKTSLFLLLMLFTLTSLPVYADTYNPSEHTLDAVEDILDGTDLSNKLMEYKDSKGNAISMEMTYGEAILAAGAELDVSPLELAATIVQETGGNLEHLTTSPLDYIYDKAENVISKNPEEVSYASFKTTTKVNYRDGAGTSYNKVGTLEKGTIIKVEVGYSKKADGYVWYRFKNDAGTYYVASEYLEKIANVSPDTPDIPQEPETPAITYTKYKTTTNVNYRDGAGTSYNKKGTLNKGTVIEVEDGYSKTANGYTWVRFKNNTGTYYVASEYLEKAETSTPDIPQNPDTPQTPEVTYTKYKTTTNVNYRDGAGTSYTKKGTLSKGTVIEVENGYSKTANGYTWVRFKNSAGTYYVASEYLTKAESTVPDVPNTPEEPQEPTITYTKYKTTTKVNYRDGAGTSYNKKGSLAAGTIIEVEDGYSKTANGYTWVRFKNSSRTYYIASEYLKKVDGATPETPQEPETPAVTYTKYETTTKVNYRSGAGTSYEKKGSLAAGTVIEVENGYSKIANGYTWVRFKYNNQTYYIASEYLTKVQ